jgi:hypothetical protein
MGTHISNDTEHLGNLNDDLGAAQKFTFKMNGLRMKIDVEISYKIPQILCNNPTTNFFRAIWLITF